AAVLGTRTLQQTREEMALRATLDDARRSTSLSPSEIADLERAIRQHPGLPFIADELKIVQSLFDTGDPSAALRSYIQLTSFRVANPDRLDPDLSQAIAHAAGNVYNVNTSGIASMFASMDNWTYSWLRDDVLAGPRGVGVEGGRPNPSSVEQQNTAIQGI